MHVSSGLSSLLYGSIPKASVRFAGFEQAKNMISGSRWVAEWQWLGGSGTAG
jgi:hypothetical protein